MSAFGVLNTSRTDAETRRMSSAGPGPPKALFDSEEVLSQDRHDDAKGEESQAEGRPIDELESFLHGLFSPFHHRFVSRTTSSKVRMGQKKLHHGVWINSEVVRTMKRSNH